MQSEDLDKKIREAADKHHPVYDESAWNKMQRLLDEHLPQKKDDKRRIIFFLFFFLMLLGGTYLLISKPWLQEEKVSKTKAEKGNEKEKNLSGETQQKNSELNSQVNQKNEIAPQRNSSTSTPLLQQGNIQPVTIANDKNISSIQKKKQISLTSGSGRDSKEQNIAVSRMAPDQEISKENTAITVVDNNQMKDPVSMPDKIQISDVIKSDKDNLLINSSELKTQKTINKTENETVSKDEKSPVSASMKTKRPRNGSAFGFTLSAGPEFNAVHFNDIGKLTFSYGAGFSYTLKKFTLRSGFYVNKKIYSADSSDYHPPTGYWLYSNNLERVDADCKVYEIPISISYNFIQSKKSNWFASVGVSSYLMKYETYNYHYKIPSGQYRSYAWTLENKNKHYFSVMTISGGYEYKLNNSFSVMAEPYLKLPLHGIGFGKTKLNSAGVLLTVGIKPFAGSK